MAASSEISELDLFFPKSMEWNATAKVLVRAFESSLGGIWLFFSEFTIEWGLLRAFAYFWQARG